MSGNKFNAKKREKRDSESDKKRDSRESGVVKVLASALAVGALVAGVSYLTNSLNKSEYETNFRTAIESGCRINPVVANEDSNYMAWATEALGPGSSLAGKLNRDNVYDIMSITNDNREVISGQTYEILRCD